MKLSYTTLGALLAAFLISMSSIAVVFADIEKVEGQEVAVSDCQLEKYTDPEVFAAAMANPAEIMKIMMIMTNPASAQNMMECSMNPEQWSVWMTRMSDPTKMMNAAIQFMNPQMYMNWMTASMNPGSFTPMFGMMNQMPNMAATTPAE